MIYSGRIWAPRCTTVTWWVCQGPRPRKIQPPCSFRKRRVANGETTMASYKWAWPRFPPSRRASSLNFEKVASSLTFEKVVHAGYAVSFGLFRNIYVCVYEPSRYTSLENISRCCSPAPQTVSLGHQGARTAVLKLRDVCMGVGKEAPAFLPLVVEQKKYATCYRVSKRGRHY